MGFIDGIVIGILFIIMIGVINIIRSNQKQIIKLKEDVKQLQEIIVIILTRKDK
mgnify:FL=1